jgi:DivIVA domain-containing protein
LHRADTLADVEAIVQFVSAHDPATELRTLRSSLLFEEALRGRVELRPASFSGSAPSGEALVITLGADGAGAALTRGLATWMQHDRLRPRVRLTVDIEPGQLTQATTHELTTLLEPAAGSFAGDTAPRPSQGDDRQRFIARIETSVFPKPPIGRRGYDEDEVDDFLDAVIASLKSGNPMDPAAVGAVSFGRSSFGRRGYDEDSVDELLDEIQQQLRKFRS